MEAVATLQRMAAHGTLEPVDGALQKAAVETKPSSSIRVIASAHEQDNRH